MSATSAALLKSWREYPAQFVFDNFQDEPDEWQVEVLNALGGSYKPVRRVAMKACTGPGKTRVLGWAGWHRLGCFGSKGRHPKGAALAISRDNLKDNLWPELIGLREKSDYLKSQFDTTKERIFAIDHPETWFLSARSFSKDADEKTIGNSLSGLHGPFPFILLDEIGDMPEAVGKKANQIFTGSPVDAAIIAAGNPTSINGMLYAVCTRFREQWVVITVTADPDDPRRTPRISVEYAQEEIRLNGRDNPWIMATILGLFPPAGFNSLLSVTDVEEAMDRHYRPEQYNFAAKILGVDVARMGDDRSVIGPRQGLVCFRPKIFRNVKSTDLAGHVAMAEDKWLSDGTIVDGTGGYGSGVIDALSQMGRVALDCQFAGSPFNPKYANKRAEIVYEFAEWIKGGGALPNIPELVAELTTPTYTFQGDKILIEPKDSIKKRLGRSPDLADAYAVTFAYPIAPLQRGVAQPVGIGLYPALDGWQGKKQGINGDYNPLERWS